MGEAVCSGVNECQAKEVNNYCCMPHMNLFFPLGCAIILSQQMAGNNHEIIQTFEAVNNCVYVCVCVCLSVYICMCVCGCLIACACVYLCGGCLLSTLFVSLMKGSGCARVKRDACWLSCEAAAAAAQEEIGHRRHLRTRRERNGGERVQGEVKQTDGAK